MKIGMRTVVGLGKTTGKQHRFEGRGMAGGKRESVKVMGQDGVQESGGGPGGKEYRNQRLGIRTDLDKNWGDQDKAR